MKMFDSKGTVVALNKPRIVSLLNSIELYRGKTLPVNEVKKVDALKEMVRGTFLEGVIETEGLSTNNTIVPNISGGYNATMATPGGGITYSSNNGTSNRRFKWFIPN